jgi:hypothetical protein
MSWHTEFPWTRKHLLICLYALLRTGAFRLLMKLNLEKYCLGFQLRRDIPHQHASTRFNVWSASVGTTTMVGTRITSKCTGNFRWELITKPKIGVLLPNHTSLSKFCTWFKRRRKWTVEVLPTKVYLRARFDQRKTDPLPFHRQACKP